MEKTLSIIVPIFNEKNTVRQVLQSILAVEIPLKKQIILVDDCSTDGTADFLPSLQSDDPSITVISHNVNRGKGAAIRSGLEHVVGDMVLIQDADLEYDPNDYIPMLEGLSENGVDVVYGSRYMKYPGKGMLANLLTGKHPGQSWTAYGGGQSLSFIGLWFTGRYLTDTVTALKLFNCDVIKPLDLQTNGFELDHEISSRILARGYRIKEVPVRYYPRTKAEGKKIGMKDWFMAIRTFKRFRNG